MIEHLFLSKTPANLEGMCIFRRNNYCLPLATKRHLEIFSVFKGIMQRNEVEKRINAQRNNGKLLKNSSKITETLWHFSSLAQNTRQQLPMNFKPAEVSDQIILVHSLSCIVRKPDFSLFENKGADQLRSNFSFI